MLLLCAFIFILSGPTRMLPLTSSIPVTLAIVAAESWLIIESPISVPVALENIAKSY